MSSEYQREKDSKMSESTRTRTSPPKRPYGGANVSQTMPLPPAHIPCAAAALEIDSPPTTEWKISLRSMNGPGENVCFLVCFMDTILMCILWGTVSGPRLLHNRIQAKAAGWARLVDKFVYAPWRRLMANGGEGREDISQEAWAAIT